VLLKLERSRKPLILTTISDSLRNHIMVESRNSIAYFINIAHNLGIGMWVERNNPKRYGYPFSIKIDPLDTTIKVYKNYRTPKKGNLFLHVSLPHINSFYMQPIDENKKLNTGFWGLSLGLDYYHRNNQYFHVSASAVADLFIPVPAAIDFSGEVELMNSLYVSFSHHHKQKRLSFGYGISYGKNIWAYKYFRRFDAPPPPRESVTKSLDAFGLIFPVYYQIGKNFHLGIVYRPTFVRMNTEQTLAYEHLISIDFAWKIRLKN
jgi:hypothetical protein